MTNLTINSKIVLLLLFLVLMTKKINAQFDAIYTQYMFNEMFINPGYAGSKEAMSATLLHRQQWIDFPGRPVTTSFSFHGPIQNNKMGLGLSILNDKIGVLNRNLVYGTYAYRIKTGVNGSLAMGLMGGIDSQVNKFSELKTNNDGSTDPQLGQNTLSLIAPNFGAGLYFNTQSFYAGISIPRMIDNQVKFGVGGSSDLTTSKLDISKFTYFITLGKLVVLNQNIKLKANGMINLVQNAPIQYDLGLNFLWSEMLWTGLSYRSSSASAIVGFQISKQFLVSYSYDYSLNAIQKYSQGSHEFVLNYLFSFDGKKIISPRYF